MCGIAVLNILMEVRKEQKCESKDTCGSLHHGDKTFSVTMNDQLSEKCFCNVTMLYLNSTQYNQMW